MVVDSDDVAAGWCLPASIGAAVPGVARSASAVLELVQGALDGGLLAEVLRGERCCAFASFLRLLRNDPSTWEGAPHEPFFEMLRCCAEVFQVHIVVHRPRGEGVAACASPHDPRAPSGYPHCHLRYDGRHYVAICPC